MTTPKPGQRVPRVFPPGSAEPDDIELLDASNGVRFKRVRWGNSPLHEWLATSPTGDGCRYVWFQMNGDNAAEGPLTLTEVVPESEKSEYEQAAERVCAYVNACGANGEAIAPLECAVSKQL